MPARLYVCATLAPHIELDLPAGAARHAQVLRLQPGSAITLFDGRGGEWSAVVSAMGRSTVRVRVESIRHVERELAVHVTLAVGMPANERMDALVEKATELGVSGIQPLHCTRSVLRLAGERAVKKVAHWQAVAQSACEQSGRTRLPVIAPVRALVDWLASLPTPPETASNVAGTAQTDPCADTRLRLLLNPNGTSLSVVQHIGTRPAAQQERGLISLSGPEGGLTDDEERAAQRHGFVPVSLGARILRADTAPLALLAHVALCLETSIEGPG